MKLENRLDRLEDRHDRLVSILASAAALAVVVGIGVLVDLFDDDE